MAVSCCCFLFLVHIGLIRSTPKGAVFALEYHSKTIPLLSVKYLLKRKNGFTSEK